VNLTLTLIMENIDLKILHKNIAHQFELFCTIEISFWVLFLIRECDMFRLLLASLNLFITAIDLGLWLMFLNDSHKYRKAFFMVFKIVRY